MTNQKLYRGTIALGVALPEAFANWQQPAAAELNGSFSWNLTGALIETGTKFDLGNSTSDKTLTYASTADMQTLTFYQPSVIFEFNRSSDATATNMANTAYQLLQFPDTDYYAWLRIGKDPAAAFAVGDVVSMVHVSTDWPVENAATGKNLTMTQTFLTQGDLIWKYKLTA